MVDKRTSKKKSLFILPPLTNFYRSALQFTDNLSESGKVPVGEEISHTIFQQGEL